MLFQLNYNCNYYWITLIFERILEHFTSFVNTLYTTTWTIKRPLISKRRLRPLSKLMMELLKSQSERESLRLRKPKVQALTSLLLPVVKGRFTESKAQKRIRKKIKNLNQDHRRLMLLQIKSLREREHLRKRMKMQKKAKPMVKKQNHAHKLLSLNIERKVKVMKLLRTVTRQLVVKRPRPVVMNLKIKDLLKIWFILILWTSRRKESISPNGKNIAMEIGEKALERLTSHWKLKFLDSQTRHYSSQMKRHSTKNRLKSRRRSKRLVALLRRRKLHLKKFSIRRSRI